MNTVTFLCHCAKTPHQYSKIRNVWAVLPHLNFSQRLLYPGTEKAPRTRQLRQNTAAQLAFD